MIYYLIDIKACFAVTITFKKYVRHTEISDFI